MHKFNLPMHLNGLSLNVHLALSLIYVWWAQILGQSAPLHHMRHPVWTHQH